MRSHAAAVAQERQYSAFRGDLNPLEEKRALSGLLVAIPDKSELTPTASALTRLPGGSNLAF